LKSATSGETPLPIGTFVAADIEGLQVNGVVRVPRGALRANNQLMLVDDDNKLRIRTVELLRSDAEHAYLRNGAAAGDRICLTTIESPLDGMKVRTPDDPVSDAGTSEQQVVGADRS
jgi:predicted membrane GTPase involved in stress response